MGIRQVKFADRPPESAIAPSLASRRTIKSAKPANGQSTTELRPVKGINRSAARALNILLEVARTPKPLSFVDFQKRLKLPKATLHKLLFTLEQMTFLQRDLDSGKYVVGLATLELAAGATVQGDLRSVVAPILLKLVREWNETCHLGILDGIDEVLLQRLDPPEQVVRLATLVGRRHPAYASAGGLAVLALPPGKAVLDQLPEVLQQVTKNTVKTRTELEVRLDEVRTKGYALDMEEVYPGVRCVGVGVSVPGWPTVSISFSLPRQRASLDRLRTLAKPLITASKDIEAILAVTPNSWGS